MDRLILKQEIVDAIKKDQVLYGKVATLIDVTILSMRKVLNDNSRKLTEASVLKFLKEYLGVDESELLESVEKSDCNINAQHA